MIIRQLIGRGNRFYLEIMKRDVLKTLRLKGVTSKNGDIWCKGERNCNKGDVFFESI